MERPRESSMCPTGMCGTWKRVKTSSREAKEDWVRLTLHPLTIENKGLHSPGTRRGLGERDQRRQTGGIV